MVVNKGGRDVCPKLLFNKKLCITSSVGFQIYWKFHQNIVCGLTIMTVYASLFLANFEKSDN